MNGELSDSWAPKLSILLVERATHPGLGDNFLNTGMDCVADEAENFLGAVVNE